MQDWRIRPLKSNMLDYARNDTHWLIYIFEKLKEDLITLAVERNEKNSHIYVKEVFVKSADLCKFQYKTIKPPSIWKSLKVASK